MIVYGISTCNSCKTALKVLERAGISHSFRDIRAMPLSEVEIDEIVTEFGDRAINKQSTTYRGFSDFLRESQPEAQIAAQPTVMKRPVFRTDNGWFIGWDDKTEAAVLA
jgi:arsenate reductase